MFNFILFATDGCHLCEDATQILSDLGVDFQMSDIMDKAEWQEKYALKIPVLWQIDSENQLDWPFDRLAVENFLSQTCRTDTRIKT